MIARALGVALAVAVLSAGVQTFRLAAEQREHAATKAAHAEQLAGLERAAREAEQHARAEEQRRIEALQGAVDEAESKLAQVRADAAASATAGERLRQRVTQIAATCRRGSRNSSASASGKAADATGDMLTVVQRRLDEAADAIARHADESRVSGLACQRSYEGLTR